MAGHSKWSQIKHKKAKEDAKRGQAFTKLIKEITVAARLGGGDPAGNPRLRLLMEKAKEINMPQENTVRAIKKGTGELPGVSYEQFNYEGYGPYGIAVIVETLSDNKNRTVASLRHIFSKHNGNLSETGSVNWMFEPMGIVRVKTSKTEDELLELLLDYDVNDIRQEDGLAAILCNPKALESIKKALSSSAIIVESADIEQVAKNNLSLSQDQADKALDFLSTLQDDEDVQNVYTNLA
jgi:YebC/PmpR family DNA-binding regulatory protein